MNGYKDTGRGRALRFIGGMTLAALALAGAPRDGIAQSTHDCLPAASPDSTAPTIRREAISILSDTSVGARRIRTEYGIAPGTAADAVVVQDDLVCNAAMTAFETFTGKQFPEAFVIVRLGTRAPHFYLMTPRREGALSARYLLNAKFELLALIGETG